MNPTTQLFILPESSTDWTATTVAAFVGECEAHSLIPSYVTRLLAEGDEIQEIGPYLVSLRDVSTETILRIQETGEEDRFTTLAAFESVNEEDEETREIARGLKVGDSVLVGFGFRLERVQ